MDRTYLDRFNTREDTNLVACDVEVLLPLNRFFLEHKMTFLVGLQVIRPVKDATIQTFSMMPILLCLLVFAQPVEAISHGQIRKRGPKRPIQLAFVH